MISAVPILLASSGCLSALGLAVLGTALGLSQIVPAILAVGLISPNKDNSRSLFLVCMITTTTVFGFVVAVQITAFVDDLPFENVLDDKMNSSVVCSSSKWVGGLQAGSHLAGVGIVSGMSNLLGGWVMGKLGKDLVIAIGKRASSLGKAIVLFIFASLLNIIGFVVSQLILSQIIL